MSKRLTHKWIDGYPSKVPADVAGRELKKLRTAHGERISAQQVVDVARPEDSPLHPAFEWNDAEAAEAYRRGQAKSLIRAIVTVHPTTKDEVREYVGVSGDVQGATKRESTVYVTTQAAVGDAGLFAQAVQRLEMHVGRARGSLEELRRAAAQDGLDPDRLARIALAVTAIEAASAAVSGLH